MPRLFLLVPADDRGKHGAMRKARSGRWSGEGVRKNRAVLPLQLTHLLHGTLLSAASRLKMSV
jgi:hypothetical protein